MNNWILFNKRVHVLNILFVTNGYVQVLGSDGSSFNSPNGDYDCFYIHHCNSCCLAGLLILDVVLGCGKGFSSFQGRSAGRVFL